MGAQRIGDLGQLTDEEIPRPVLHRHGLLCLGLDRHETHGRPRDGFTDRLRVCGIGLSAPDEGLDIGWRHEPDVMAKLDQFPCPVVRAGTGFHADQTGPQP